MRQALNDVHGPSDQRNREPITLVAGFASTVGWPLSALLEVHFGWRGT
jgi:hypothetical protein